jgi:hypothetical protein
VAGTTAVGRSLARWSIQAAGERSHVEPTVAGKVTVPAASSVIIFRGSRFLEKHPVREYTVRGGGRSGSRFPHALLEEVEFT